MIISKAQARALVAIDDLITMRGIPPTQIEISTAIGSKHNSVARHHVLNLQQMGLINVAEKISRGISITPKGKKAAREFRQELNG